MGINNNLLHLIIIEVSYLHVNIREIKKNYILYFYGHTIINITTREINRLYMLAIINQSNIVKLETNKTLL